MLKKVFINCCLLVIFLVSVKDIFAQKCVDCGQRILRVNELKVNVPTTTVEEMTEVKKLQGLVDVFFLVINKQAGVSCFEYLQASQTHGSYGEYQISGLITGVVGNYTLSITLVATKDNDLLASGTTQFTENETTLAPIFNAYASLTSGKNLYDIIYAYEKKRRDAETEYAIQPRIKLLIPQTNLKPGDAMSFEVELLDCDKEPLKNRIITFDKPPLGTLDKYQVTTDDKGKAILIFTSPKRSGYSSIKANYDFTYASGRHGGSEANDAYLVVGDPDAPPFIAFDCNAASQMPKAEKWAKKQWPQYMLKSTNPQSLTLYHWKIWRKGWNNVPQMNIERDNTIKSADEEIDKMKDIFQKYKSVPEYSFALNYLLKFSYDLYKDALEKEPQWDIKKDAGDFNLKFADSYLTKVRSEHKYSVANFVMYFINEYKIFKDEDKVAEYDKKLQNALKFKFKMTGSYTRHTAAGITSTTNFDYDKIIDCWTHPSIEDKIMVTYSETDENGKMDSHKDQNPLQFSWDFKICKDEKEKDDDFTPVPLVKDNGFTPAPLVPPGSKYKIQFVVDWFTFPGGGYIPFDLVNAPLGFVKPDGRNPESTTFPFPDMTGDKTFSYSQLNSQDGDTETYSITIHLTHTPQ